MDVETTFLAKKGAKAALRSLCSLYGTVKTVASSMPKCRVAPSYRSSFALKEYNSSEKLGSLMCNSCGVIRTIGPEGTRLLSVLPSPDNAQEAVRSRRGQRRLTILIVQSFDIPCEPSFLYTIIVELVPGGQSSQFRPRKLS